MHFTRATSPEAMFFDGEICFILILDILHETQFSYLCLKNCKELKKYLYSKYGAKERKLKNSNKLEIRLSTTARETSNSACAIIAGPGNELVIGIIYRIVIQLNFPLNH